MHVYKEYRSIYNNILSIMTVINNNELTVQKTAINVKFRDGNGRRRFPICSIIAPNTIT